MSSDADKSAVLRWISYTALWIGGLLVAGLSFSVPWKPAAILMFYTGTSAATKITFSVLNDRFYFRWPPSMLRPLTIILPPWLTLGVYIFPNHYLRLYIFVAAAAGFIVLPALSGAAWFVFERLMLLMPYKEFAQGVALPATSRIGLCLFEPGIGEQYGHRLVASLRTGAAMRGSLYMFMCFDAKSFRRRSLAFEDEAMHRVQAILVFKAPASRADQAFEALWQERLRTAMGHVYVILVTPFGIPTVTPGPGRGLTYFAFRPSSEKHEQAFHAEFASQILEDVRLSIVPVGDADDEMQGRLREIARAIALTGLSPVANAYLRLRIARSNVERFLISLDCLELLIRLAAISLTSRAWQSSLELLEPPSTKWLARPTLGTWVDALRKLVTDERITDPFVLYLRSAFHDPPCPLALDAMTEAKRIGLSWEGKQPVSHLEWLEWLLWLRNVTRGHGAVDEERVATLWVSLHSVFLEMVSGLQEIVVNSVIGAQGTMSPGGWVRTLDHNTDWSSFSSSADAAVYMRRRENTDETPILLHPFVLQRGESFLLWNAIRGDSIEYVDYASGALLQMDLGTTDPYALWKAATST